MKIDVIGSGAIFTKYNSASYLIDDKILLDVPNGTCKKLMSMKKDIHEIRNVIITHFHADHYFDFPFLYLNQMSDEGKTTVYCDKDESYKLYDLVKLGFPHIADIMNEHISYNFENEFKIGKYKVKKVRVEHQEMINCYGYIFDDGNKKIGFTGDSNLCDGSIYLASNCDYLISDCSYIEGKKSHLGIDNLLELLNKNSNLKIFTSHMNDDVREYLNKEKIDRITPLNDFEEINL